MALNIAGIDHIVLRTTRLGEMLAFYCGVLGCIVERALPPETGLVQLRAGDALIDLVMVDSELGREGGGPPTATENNMDHFCLLLEPITEDEIREHLKKHKIAFGDFTERYGSEGFGLSTYIQDPEGNTVELRSKNG
ncbi:Glyoxalase/Bleomycin resistance protein/Dioxygenase superfamily protein [Amphritea atlantica]|uniref:Glyoxalase/Bleomycin resistance protein/Dioxygenase superfamily protein n=1 Tax=Amphritea atlantica TaxID=355243 RepID=A0A1H9D922_9GAMM|nr:VOC family protein [Amphritea atlantica]SEQ09985.1 Glyoxalase/Bleomycin resistance protein/Dioxygenase superfamily protein [Amphritea atlantica]